MKEWQNNMKKKVLLAVTASIAAYKAILITQELRKKGYDVRIIITKEVTKFIQPLTFEVISGQEVGVEVMEEKTPGVIQHIDWAKECDIFLVAPASANIIGKLANGIADDLVSTTALAISLDKSRYIAPAMNTKMYENPAVQRNLKTLKEDGYQIIEPREDLLACGDVGKGALAEIENIIKEIA